MHLLAESFWFQLREMLLTPSLQLFLLVGSAVLAILLLVLTLTRLGHARPVMKCVILSVIAHILLLGYAYGTKLIFEYPAIADPVPMEVTLSQYDEYPVEITADEQPVDGPHTQIDRFSDTSTMMPEVETLQRPAMDSELVIEPVPDTNLEEIGSEVHSMRGTFETPEEEVPTAFEPLEIESQFDSSELETPQIEAPPLLPTDFDPDSSTAFEPKETVVEPEEIEVQRRGDEEQVVAAPETTPEIPDESSSEMEMPPVEIERSELESAFMDDQHRAEQFESELVAPDADHKVVEGFLPSSTSETSAAENPSTPTTAATETQVTPVKNRLRVGDGQVIPKLYSLRDEANRKKVAQRRGGSDETERAVAAALEWLAKTQKSDGRWDPRETGAGQEQRTLGHDRGGCGANADTGITALATLAFLGAGNSHLEGKHQVVVQKALEFLVRSQTSDGNLAGDARLFARMYCHSMSLLALSEALAVTGDQRLVDSVRAGVGYSTRAQNQTDGGWRYQPGDRGDMSQFGWQVLALHSAAIGGIQVDQATIDRMHQFLDLCTTGDSKGLAAYRPGQGPSTTMTAEALLCRYFMKGRASAQTVSEAQNRILRETPSVSGKNFYYWYYATMAMYHTGGNAWSKWNRELKETLLPMQAQGGSDHGSWRPDGMWCGYGGKVYSTAMATLCLEVYYRYLPIYEVANR